MLRFVPLRALGCLAIAHRALAEPTERAAKLALPTATLLGGGGGRVFARAAPPSSSGGGARGGVFAPRGETEKQLAWLHARWGAPLPQARRLWTVFSTRARPARDATFPVAVKWII